MAKTYLKALTLTTARPAPERGRRIELDQTPWSHAVPRKPVIQTYELYLDVGGAEPRFRALTCEAEDLIRKVLDVLADEGAASAEIRRFGLPLFTLASGQSAPLDGSI